MVVGASDAVADTDAMGCIVECMCVFRPGAHTQVHTYRRRHTLQVPAKQYVPCVPCVECSHSHTRETGHDELWFVLVVLAVAWSGRRLVHASSLRPPFSSAARPLFLLRSFVPTPLLSSSPFVFSLRLLPSSSRSFFVSPLSAASVVVLAASSSLRLPACLFSYRAVPYY